MVTVAVSKLAGKINHGDCRPTVTLNPKKLVREGNDLPKSDFLRFHVSFLEGLGKIIPW